MNEFQRNIGGDLVANIYYLYYSEGSSPFCKKYDSSIMERMIQIRAELRDVAIQKESLKYQTSSDEIWPTEKVGNEAVIHYNSGSNKFIGKYFFISIILTTYNRLYIEFLR